MSEDEIEEVEEIGTEEALKKKHAYGVPEYIIDNDFPPLLEEVANMLEEEERPRIPPPDIRTLIKLVGKRKNAIIILKFFYERNDTYSAVDVSRALKPYMSEAAVRFNLLKLCKVRLMKATQLPQLDKKTIYYTLVDRNVAGLIVKDALNRISYILAHYVPYNKVRIKEIKEDSRFAGKCHYFGLSINEGIDLVKKCPKIGVEYGKGSTFLWRKVQGYIPPKPKEPAEQEVELLEIVE